ncbi:MAG TPA: hypothetical protein VGP82_04860 [Ktedonobacterales bacterium]|nr:hypothetical protein [Ktedonobacterales bacterium]
MRAPPCRARSNCCCPYSFAAYVFLAVVSAFRVHTLAAVFLSGALFGWLIEGVFVQTAYDSQPLSISFTGLAWHALLTVLVGWWALQWGLRSSIWRALWVSSLVGSAYGLWATSWWAEAPPPTPLSAFVLYILATTLALVIAYRLAARLRVSRFTPSRLEWAVMLLVILIYFALITVPQQPLALVVLPPLVALVLFILWRNRRIETRDDALTTLYSSPAVCISHVLALLVLPLAAGAIYGLLLALDVRFPTNIVLYLITTPLGFIALIVSLVQTFRIKKRLPESAASPVLAAQLEATSM